MFASITATSIRKTPDYAMCSPNGLSRVREGEGDAKGANDYEAMTISYGCSIRQEKGKGFPADKK